MSPDFSKKYKKSGPSDWTNFIMINTYTVVFLIQYWNVVC